METYKNNDPGRLITPWFALLEIARYYDDLKAERMARKRLAQLGVSVIFHRKSPNKKETQPNEKETK